MEVLTALIADSASDYQGSFVFWGPLTPSVRGSTPQYIRTVRLHSGFFFARGTKGSTRFRFLLSIRMERRFSLKGVQGLSSRWGTSRTGVFFGVKTSSSTLRGCDCQVLGSIRWMFCTMEKLFRGFHCREFRFSSPSNRGEICS